MVLWATLLILHGASLAGSMPASGAPENVTIVFLSPTSVRISWTITLDKVDKYDVTYKPTDARSVRVTSKNTEAANSSTGSGRAYGSHTRSTRGHSVTDTSSLNSRSRPVGPYYTIISFEPSSTQFLVMNPLRAT